MAVQKGKQGTKGAKQIVEENASTLIWYRNMMLGSFGIYFILNTISSGPGYGTWDIVFFIFAAAITCGCFQFMNFMATPKYSSADSKQLLDSGVDLNMEAGVAEHVKDVLIITCGCQTLSYFSKYVRLFWLLVPIKGVYYAWTKLIAPWIFAPAPETDEKKTKKMERRMRR